MSQEPASPVKPAKKGFLNSINHFRGIAIIFIVMAHCYRPAGWEIETFADKAWFNLMMNGTVFFVFISGFLFHHVFFSRWDYEKYMRNKTKYVFFPYLLLSIPWIIWHLTADASPNLHQLHANIEDITTASSWYVITGRALTAYWYIPMGMMLFAISPWVLDLTRKNALMTVAIPLFIVAMIVHRPISNLNALQSLLYFLPIYLIGVWSSLNKDKLFAVIDKWWWALFIAAAGLAVIQAHLFGAGVLNKGAFELTVPDLMLPQKLLFTFGLLGLLNNFEHVEVKWLQKLAEASFAIYFIHPWLTTPWWMIYQSPDIFGFSGQGNILTTLVVTAGVILISYVIAVIIRKLFAKKSRYIIGW